MEGAGKCVREREREILVCVYTARIPVFKKQSFYFPWFSTFDVLHLILSFLPLVTHQNFYRQEFYCALKVCLISLRLKLELPKAIVLTVRVDFLITFVHLTARTAL